jgi:hypothetical protein
MSHSRDALNDLFAHAMRERWPRRFLDSLVEMRQLMDGQLTDGELMSDGTGVDDSVFDVSVYGEPQIAGRLRILAPDAELAQAMFERCLQRFCEVRSIVDGADAGDAAWTRTHGDVVGNSITDSMQAGVRTPPITLPATSQIGPEQPLSYSTRPEASKREAPSLKCALCAGSGRIALQGKSLPCTCHAGRQIAQVEQTRAELVEMTDESGTRFGGSRGGVE